MSNVCSSPLGRLVDWSIQGTCRWTRPRPQIFQTAQAHTWWYNMSPLNEMFWTKNPYYLCPYSTPSPSLYLSIYHSITLTISLHILLRHPHYLFSFIFIPPQDLCLSGGPVPPLHPPPPVPGLPRVGVPPTHRRGQLPGGFTRDGLVSDFMLCIWQSKKSRHILFKYRVRGVS